MDKTNFLFSIRICKFMHLSQVSPVSGSCSAITSLMRTIAISFTYRYAFHSTFIDCR